MEDISSKISELIGSPEGLEKIKAITSMLGGSMGDFGESSKHEESEKCDKDMFDLDSSPLGGLLSNPETMETIMKILPALSSINGDDEKTLFIKALKPHLKPERQKRADEAIKIMQLLKLLPLLDGAFGFF